MMQVDKNDNVECQFIKALGRSGGFDLLVNAGDIALNEIVDNEIVDNILVLKTVVNICKSYGGVKNYLFVKKVISFFNNFKGLTEKNDRILLIN